MKVRVERITPKQAQIYLAEGKNHKNFRNVDQRFVDRYVDDMLAGRWKENGEAIILDDKDRCVDGQHRLIALIKAEKTISFVVVRGGVTTETMNTGKRRNFSNWLQYKGEVNATTLGSAIRNLLLLEFGPTTERSTRITEAEMMEKLKAHPAIRDSATTACLSAPAFSIPRGVVAALHYSFSQLDSEMADRWVEAVYVGDNLRRGDPVLLLRKRLIDQPSSRTRIRSLDVMALCIKTWNAWRQNCPLGVLKWTRVGPGAEDFPTIK